MKQLILPILLLLSTTLFAIQPEWVRSYGTDSPYPSSRYLTGFSMIDRDEYQSDLMAKEKAIADLSGKIQTMVFSEIVLKEADDGTTYNSSASVITKNTVNISVSGVEYLIYQDRSNSYALAYVDRKDLSDYNSVNGLNIIFQISDSFSLAKKLIDTKETTRALAKLYKIETDFLNFW